MSLGPTSAHDRHQTVFDILARCDRIYASRADLVTALPNLPQGTTVSIGRAQAIVDSTAVGPLSALADLGVDGVKMVGTILDFDWWRAPGSGSQSLAVKAMMDYVDAHFGQGVAACTLRFAGVIRIADQITLGTFRTGTDKVCNIDAKGAVFDVIAGGNLVAIGDICAILIRNCAKSMIEFAQVQCNHISGGIQVDRCTNSMFDGVDVNKFRWRAFWVRGNVGDDSPGTSAGTVFNKITGVEWSNVEPEFQISSNYVATGILNESHDVRFVAAHIGWCGQPIHNKAGSCEYDMCHPFNGNATGNGTRFNPGGFLNEGEGNVNIYNMYGDNGYVIDEGGGLCIDGLVMLDNNSVMTHPYVRRRTDVGSLNNTWKNIRTSIGFYKGAFRNNFSNADPDYRYEPEPSFSGGISREVDRQQVRYIMGNLQPDNITIKYGTDASTEIVERFWPGRGESVSRRIRNGVVIYQRGTTDSGEVRVSNSKRVGIGTEDGVSPLIFYADGEKGRFQDSGNFIPAFNGTQALGLPNARWSTVHAVSGSINTSDAREKTAPLPIDDAVLDAWGDVSMITFQWLKAVAEEGDDARLHFGVIAQQVRDAFAARGLDGTRYGLLCHDEWEGGDRWALRPDQCAFLEAAYQRRRAARIEERLACLESRLT